MIGGRGFARAKLRVRRSPHIVAYWQDGAFVACNYATGTTVQITPLVCEVLDICRGWTGLDAIGRALGDDGPPLTALIARLVAFGLLQQDGRRSDPREQAMAKLASWNPEFGFFHVSSRDVRFGSGREIAGALRRRGMRRMPAVVKKYPAAEQIRLPRPRVEGEFAGVLRSRRTWRRFGSAPVTIEELATLLAFTAGVQQWITAGGQRLPLKISPSGGARHGIECYVVSRSVQGLRAGVYHYAADAHALERLRGPVSLSRLRAYVPSSEYFAGASAMIFFTAVFDRILWRYPYSRAYRAALVEAGHVCQTFCLTANWLSLAPFCLMGLADSLIEHDLGIDGICEPVLYGAGVGRRPPRAAWSPLPRRGTFRILPNRHLS